MLLLSLLLLLLLLISSFLAEFKPAIFAGRFVFSSMTTELIESWLVFTGASPAVKVEESRRPKSSLLETWVASVVLVLVLKLMLSSLTGWIEEQCKLLCWR